MDILTPFQKQILIAVGHSPLKQTFYLTGGTALAAYYLQHRYSEDLDFFTDSQEAVSGVTAILSDIAHELGATAEFTRTFSTFVECFLGNSPGERVKLDFAFDSPFRLQPTREDAQFGIQVDNVIDIACNKLSALFGRFESKDYVDVYFICQDIMPFPELFAKAQQKHVGLTNYWLAVAMKNIEKAHTLPRMIRPVELADLQAYFLNLAQQLIADIGDSDIWN
jgi:hypothetical protein